MFDEQRYLSRGRGRHLRLTESNGISICEDIWEHGPPPDDEALAGAQLIVKLPRRPTVPATGAPGAHSSERAGDYLAADLFVNTVGGQDDWFSTATAWRGQDGHVLARCPQFEESLTFCTIDPREVAAARLRDTRHRVNVRRQRRAAAVAEPPVVHLASLEAPSEGETVGGDVAPLLEPEAEVYAALRTGLRDYVEKNGFGQV